MLKFLSHASLRQMLTVPYVVLVLLSALVIGLLSYRAGSEAVDDLSPCVPSTTTKAFVVNWVLVLNAIARDLRRLAFAAKSMGDGILISATG